MSNFAAGILIVAITDGMLFLAGLALYRSGAASAHRNVAPWAAVSSAAGALLAHFMALYYGAGLTQDKFVVLAITCLFGILPAGIFALVVRDAFADRAINMIMGSEESIDRVDLSRAREYSVKGDIENARRAYQAIARQYPQSSDPLFGLESTYMIERRYEEAASVCRDIMRKFASDAQVRRRAALRLAELLEDHLGNPDGAAAARAEADIAANAGWHPIKGEREQQAAAKVGAKALTNRATLEEARRLARQGNVVDAVVVYEKVYEMVDDHPRPLMEAASLLERDGNPTRALEMLRRVARDFEERPEYWGAATLHQATIHENHLHDTETACRILGLIQDRLPGTEHAQVALDRLAALRSKQDPARG